MHLDINQFNCRTKNHIFDNSKFDNDGFIIFENILSYKSTDIISYIFQEHWEYYYSKYKHTLDIFRPNAKENH